MENKDIQEIKGFKPIYVHSNRMHIAGVENTSPLVFSYSYLSEDKKYELSNLGDWNLRYSNPKTNEELIFSVSGTLEECLDKIK